MISTHLLWLSFQQNGNEDFLYPVLITSPQGNILVDCGYPGMLPLMSEALQEAGFDWHQVDALFITHHDIDHFGCAAAIKASHPHVQVWAPLAEQPYLTGSRKSLRLHQAEDLFDQLPPEHHAWALGFQASLKAVEPVAVDRSFDTSVNSELVPGVRIIPTPGHMPGHVSLFAPEESILITADAVVIENGRLAIANPAFTLDLPAAYDSAAKLAHLQANTLICYHGGMMTENLEQNWQALLQQRPG